MERHKVSEHAASQSLQKDVQYTRLPRVLTCTHTRTRQHADSVSDTAHLLPAA